MNILRLALLTLWFCVTWVSLVHAGPLAPIFGAIGSFLASGTLVSQLVLGLVFTGIRTGLSLLFGSKKKTQPQAGIQQDVKFGGDNPLSFIMGYYATAGQLEYANTWGEVDKTPNAYLTKVISIGDIPSEAVGIWLDDTHAVLPDMSGVAPTAMGWPLAEFRVEGQDYAWVKFLNGRQIAADPFMVATFGGDSQIPWDSTMIGRGIPMMIVTTRFRTELFGGPPAIVVETTGIPLYDPRFDSTVGGEGSQRWNDWTTWWPSNNLAVQMYNVFRGIRYGDVTLWGGDYEAYELPLPNWFAAMNVCDTAIALKEGGTEPQYRAGIEVQVNEEPASIVEELSKAGNARIGNTAGLTSIMIGEPGAPVYSFTDEQIIVTDVSTLDPFPGVDDTYNGASASYPEPLIKWGPKDAPQYVLTDLIPSDAGQERLADIQYRACPYPIQVQRNMQLAVKDYRRFKVHQFVLAPEARILAVNDIVAWTSAYNQYVNKKFIVTEISNANGLLVTVTLREIDPSDNPWNPEEDQKDYTIPPLGSIRPPTQYLTGWQVFPYILSQGGKEMPTIQVLFDGGLDDVRAVRIQARLAETGEVVFDGEIPYGQPNEDNSPKDVVLNGVFLPNTEYEVRGILVPYSSDRLVDWSIWLPVTTPDVWINDIYPIDLDRLAEDVIALQKWIGDSIRDIQDELRAVAAEGSANSMVGFSDKQELRSELASQTGQTRAYVRETVVAATGPDSALAISVEELRAEVFDPETGLPAVADVVSLLETKVDIIDGQVTANSLAIIALQTSYDEVSANATFRMETGYTPSVGWDAKIGLQTRVSSGDVFRDAGLFIESTETTARVIIAADQFIVTDGAANVQPLVFTGGTLYLQNARIGTVYFDQLSSTNGKLIQRGYGNFADIRMFT